jgi:hypothetical protein
MNRLFRVLVVLTCSFMFIGAGVACADTLQFTLAGPVSASFELSSSPFVNAGDFGSGAGFKLAAPDLMVNGAAAASDFLAFYNTSLLGGFGIFASASNPVVHLIGPQIYSGTESNPIFSPGTFSFTAFPNGTAPFTLTVTDLSSVSTPEPSVTVLLAVGLVMVGLVLLHFKPNLSVQAS